MGAFAPEFNGMDGIDSMKDSKKTKAPEQDYVLNGVPFDESLDIFGEHKTKEQVRAEEKARKKAEREALKEEMARRRKAAKEGGVPTKRKDIIAVSAVVLAIVLLCVLALGNSLIRGEEARGWEMDAERGYIYKEDCKPEQSGEGPMADILEVYFTQNGHLYVNIAISNGTAKPLRITAVDVAVYDDATGELIAGGKATVEEELVVLVAGVSYYPFYISPEHIRVADDAVLPEVCSFDILLDSVPHVTE